MYYTKSDENVTIVLGLLTFLVNRVQLLQESKQNVRAEQPPANSPPSNTASQFGVCSVDPAGLFRPAGPLRAGPPAAAPGLVSLWSATVALSGDPLSKAKEWMKETIKSKGKPQTQVSVLSNAPE